ncbi:T3SS negative regulator,GrlR [Bradyrhizobium lablabi]|uniref:T3SS negative regulator,GrlR n=3 Tax=Nitrobacteraceae TaxID=41294 RepID=A0ABY0QCK4_9BRAD|nr:T3SS negative regulator,GrlR [Bradyrhizobium ottawaense]SEC00858.1 T3SS negative regulator,GrlR [Bradyrhizobium lablabi]
MQEGLYKVEFHTVHGTGSGMIYAINGKLRGGNSAFAFIGSYADKPDGIQARVTTQRHNDDPAFKPLFGTDMITLTLKGATMAAWWTSKAPRCNCPASTSGQS